MATSADIQGNYKHTQQIVVRELIVNSNTTIYKGTLVGVNDSGFAVVPDGTQKIVGVATEKSVGGNPVVCYYNHVIAYSLPGLVRSDIQKTVYALDNNTLTTTPNLSAVGTIVDVNLDLDLAYVHITLTADLLASQVINDSTVPGQDELTDLENNQAYRQFAATEAYDTIIQGTWVVDPTDSIFFINNPSNNGDEIRYLFGLPVLGMWMYKFKTNKTRFSGILKIYSDGTLLGTHDLYANPRVDNAIIENTFTPTVGGVTEIRLVVDGQNASSSGYDVTFAGLSIWRTA
jgi:hypothetical protein